MFWAVSLNTKRRRSFYVIILSTLRPDSLEGTRGLLPTDVGSRICLCAGAVERMPMISVDSELKPSSPWSSSVQPSAVAKPVFSGLTPPVATVVLTSLISWIFLVGVRTSRETYDPSGPCQKQNSHPA